MTYTLPEKVDLPLDLPNYEKLNKAKNIYSRMAIVFDYEFYKDNRNDSKLYKYMYFIFYMLACKKNYFPNNFDDYDRYALYASSEIYMRIIRFQKKGIVIKSILNYCKSVMYSMKVGYQYANFHEVINPEVTGFDSYTYKEKRKEEIQADYNNDKRDAINEVFSELPSITYKIVYNTPYKNDKLLCNRLYNSCLLSFINSITLNNNSKKRLHKIKDDGLIKLFKQEKENSTILWHLDPSMKDYVTVLVKKIKSEVTKSIYETENMFELPDSVIDDILSSAYSTYDTDANVDYLD